MPDIRPVLGSYEILEMVGKGGMAAVYRGRRCDTGQIIAVKVMEPAAANNPVLVRRFEQEYAAAARLRHPNIVQVYDFGQEDARPYLVMEFIDGESLGRRIAREGPLPEAEAVPILLQVADGLHSAHQQGMIHRDVKSDNILLGKNGQAKLSDLGLVKDLSNLEGLTKTRTCLGTIAFVAPEQFEDAKRADARSDVYSLGATLYHAVTGVYPFTGRRNLQILKKKLSNDFPPPRRLVPGLSRQVDEAVRQALDASPALRQATCREFMDSLRPDAGPRLKITDSGERRRALRYPIACDAKCRPLSAWRQQWKAHVQDISGTGVCVQLERRFEPGALIALEIVHTRRHTGPTLYAKVQWVRQTAAKNWSHGCAFEQALEPDELETILGDKPKTVIIHSN